MKKIVFVLLTFSLFSSLFSNNKIVPNVTLESIDSIYRFENDWQFTPSEDETDKSYLIKPIDHWQMLLPEASSYYGSSWYKMNLTINNIGNNKLGFFLPVSFGSYEFYINNTLVNKGENIFGNSQEYFEIPSNLLKQGENSLSIKASSFSAWGGFCGFPRIGPLKELRSSFNRYVFLNIFMSSILIFLSITFLIIYLIKDRKKSNILFSVSCLSVAIFIMGFSGLWYTLFNYSWSYWLLTFIGGISMYLFPLLYVHSFLRVKLGVVSKILTGLYTMFLVFTFTEYFITSQIFNFVKFLYMPFSLTYFILIIYHLAFSIYGVRKKLDGAKVSLTASLILTVGLIFSVLTFALIIKKLPPLGESFFAMLTFYSFFQIKNISNKSSLIDILSKTGDIKNIVK